ncbi:alpha/beta hydrolase [Pseudoalteromonas carrageenovora]|uniref:alpha/beta fold hydrolase n=1 Tax=Pseudoalteromonas carrageenovora TaxID=227 RepID=UPI00311F7B34
MRRVKTPQGIKLHYQDEGDKKSPVVILIMGLGAQMTVWPDTLYYGLVKKGFRVIRFDNRDTGFSTHLDYYTSPNLFKSWLSKRFPIRTKTPYLLDDMADDVLALMSALKIKKAHMVGASMGGMIAQLIAAQHKKKVISLSTIMSCSSLPRLSAKSIGVFIKLAKLQPKTCGREEAINYNIRLNQIIGSPAYPQTEDVLRHHATQIVDRAHNPNGYKRQLTAMAASKDRLHLIRKIKAPTLIIHGSDDVVIPLNASKKTAALIKKSKLKVVPGMGHNFAPELMPKMTKWLTKHIKKAQRKHLNKKQNKQKR